MSDLRHCLDPRCGRAVVMLAHYETGKLAPIDPDQHPEGNVYVNWKDETYSVLTGNALRAMRGLGWALYKRHLATCEYARRFTTQKQPRPAPQVEPATFPLFDLLGE